MALAISGTVDAPQVGELLGCEEAGGNPVSRTQRSAFTPYAPCRRGPVMRGPLRVYTIPTGFQAATDVYVAASCWTPQHARRKPATTSLKRGMLPLDPPLPKRYEEVDFGAGG